MSTSQTNCGSFQVLVDAIQTETTDISLDVLPSSTETECTECTDSTISPKSVDFAAQFPAIQHEDHSYYKPACEYQNIDHNAAHSVTIFLV